MTEAIFFYLFGGLAVVMVTAMILTTNPVTSALCLVLGFFGLAGLYVLLEAPFVAALQILVYAGAIMVLFIFVIMLLNLQPQDLIGDKVSPAKFVLVGGVMVAILVSLFYGVTLPDTPFAELPPDFGSPAAVGRLLFSEYAVPFELASVLLLVAIIGAVILGKKEKRS